MAGMVGASPLDSVGLQRSHGAAFLILPTTHATVNISPLLVCGVVVAGGGSVPLVPLVLL